MKPENLVNDILTFSKSAYDTLYAKIRELKFNKKNPQELYAVLIYVRIMELIASVFQTISGKTFVAVPILLRSVYAAHVDLINIIKRPDYHQILYANYLKEKLKLTENFKKNPTSIYSIEIMKSINVETQLIDLRKELAELQSKDYTPWKISKRSEEAELMDVYQTIYLILCLDAHNSISSLEDYHLKKSEGDWQVVFYKDIINEKATHIIALPQLLIGASKAIHAFLKTSMSFNELEAQMAELNDRFSKAE